MISLTVNVLTVEVLLGANKKKKKKNPQHPYIIGQQEATTGPGPCFISVNAAENRNALSSGPDPLCYQEGKQTIQMLIFKKAIAIFALPLFEESVILCSIMNSRP